MLWEAYNARTTRQIKFVEDNAPGFFRNHHMMKRMIQRGEFEDGTNLFHRRDTRLQEMESSRDTTHYQPGKHSLGALMQNKCKSQDPLYTTVCVTIPPSSPRDRSKRILSPSPPVLQKDHLVAEEQMLSPVYIVETQTIKPSMSNHRQQVYML